MDALVEESSGSTILMVLVILLVVWVIVFFVCRELICWYYKINKMKNTLREIQDNQCAIFEQQEKTNQLLQEIKDKLPNPQKTPAKEESKTDNEKYMPQ